MRGRVLADRFVLGEPIGQGGMGAVHEATDRHTGRTVAVKVLLPWVRNERALTRFEREAALLSAIDHAAVVRFVASGVEEDGLRFLAMEWVEGLDLARHLEAGLVLSLEDALAFARSVAGALAAVHDAGAVHRDVKPANILLRGGDPRDPVLADLGIAQVDGLDFGRATRVGSILGTLGYMAPEQARGARADSRADVFALGCVLYECLSGQPAFDGDSPRALALKILVAEVVPLSQLVCVPPSVERLIGRMLAKEPDERPDNGAALVRALTEVVEATRHESVRPRPLPTSPRITTNERQLVTTLLVPGAVAALTDTRTLDVLPEPDPELAPMLTLAEQLGGRTAQLRDGTLLVFFEGTGDARDQVAAAARIAVSGGDALRGRGVAIATGVAELAGYLPTGSAIDRAVALAREAAEGEIAVDQVSARLIGRDYVLERSGGHHRLVANRPFDDWAPFRLLGRPTEVVGRVRSLSEAESALRRALLDREPRAVLVTGASGIGKSRFLHEVAVRLLALTPRTLTLRARANASSGDEPWSVFAQSIRSALDEGLTVSDLFDGETVEEAELIHELLRIPVDSPSVKLESARQDPHIMADQVRLALLAVTTRGATRRPMLLVLDNLDAADGETLDLVGRALSDPRTGGLAVLAASRAKLPTLAWPELSEIHLGPLSRDACIEVVQNALGDDVDEHRAAILVERSEGNPFWLEELVRMEASGASDALPETVVASVQARLERLPKDARRLLRAASVFGLEFPLLPAGTLAGLRGEAIERCLAALVEAELVFPGALGTYDLRHDVIRRAAYEMLTDVDRAAAHAAAAAWLESVEGHDPRLVADHYELAGLADRAVSHHGRAAEIALGFCDFGAAVERAERALSASSDGETRGWLHYIRAEAAYWVGEPDLAVSDADEVLRLLPEGTPRWLDAKRIECGVYVQRGEMGRVIAIARALEATMPAAGHERALAATMARLASHTFLAGDADLAKRLLAKAEAHVDAHGADPLLEATIHDARARRAELSRAYVGERQERRLAGDLFEAVGARRRLCIARTNLGVAEMHIGLYEASRASLEEARALAIDLGVGSAATAAECNLGHVLSLAGEHDLGRSMLASSSARSRATGNLRFEGACAAHLARLELAVDRNVEAIRAAEEAVALLESAPTLHGYALATLAEALLAREEGERALPLADRATRAARTGVLEEGDIYTLVVHARVCAVLGRTEDAKALLAEALTEIDARAEQLDDAESRRAFLEAIPENVVARALMRDL